MKVIGLRKMVVIMWCASMITVIMVFYVCYNKSLDAAAIAGMTLIAGLGGFHSYKQGQTDAIVNGVKKNGG